MSPARKAARTRRRTKYASSQAHPVRPPTRRGPWLSGSFYLVAMLVIGALVVIAARLVHPVALPVVILGAVLAVSVVGILQLAQDGRLSERIFARLMLPVLQSVTWLAEKLRRSARSKPGKLARHPSDQDKS